jgi:hypothetical protein
MYMISGSFFIIFMVVIVTFELCQVLCLRFLLQDLSFLIEKPIWLYYNDKVICDIVYLTKHIEINIFFIKEKLENKFV